MKNGWRRIGSAVLVGLTWAMVWAPIGVLIGLIVDPDGSMDEMWVAIGAFPGALCGAVFSVVFGIAEGRRIFEEWKISRAGIWGALSGLLVGVIPFVTMESNTGPSQRYLGAVIIGSITVLSTLSAVATLALARAARSWRSLFVPSCPVDAGDAKR